MTARAVHWHEGMFLRPHHFQAMQRHWAYQSQRNDKLDHYYNWGLRSIDIDRDALANFRFEVHSLAVRLRDGTMVEMPGDGVLPAMELKGIFDDNRSAIMSRMRASGTRSPRSMYGCARCPSSVLSRT